MDLGWGDAHKKISGYLATGTFEQGSPQPGDNVISAKWVFTWKTDKFGRVVRAKARLVARGFAQREGVDVFDTLSSCLSVTSIRLLAAFACEFGLDLYHFGAEQAFILVELKTIVFTRLSQVCGVLSDKVMRLARSLCG